VRRGGSSPVSGHHYDPQGGSPSLACFEEESRRESLKSNPSWPVDNHLVYYSFSREWQGPKTHKAETKETPNQEKRKNTQIYTKLN